MTTIEEVTIIRAPLDRCFDLSLSVEVHELGNVHFGEQAVPLEGKTSGLMGLGDRVTWQARHFGVRQQLTSMITEFDRPHAFQDTMLRGAFAWMQHDHFFCERADGVTEMRDMFRFGRAAACLGLDSRAGGAGTIYARAAAGAERNHPAGCGIRCVEEVRLENMEDVLSRTPPPADKRIAYGAGALQFGDIRLPKLAAGQRAPVLMFVHGGWWKAEYGLEYGGHICAAMKADGFASWNIEYRRVGDAGGGWPGTFEDVAAGYDYLQTLAKTYPLDLERVVVAGHSAGGHLAFWLAGRHHLPETGPLAHLRAAAPMRAVVGLAGAVDLRMTIDLAGWFTFAHDKQQVVSFMGALPAQEPSRYAAADPGELVPLNVPQFLLQGTEDDQIPGQLPARWAERARRIGEQVTVEMIPDADHFDVVDPESKAWPRVRAAILKAASS